MFKKIILIFLFIFPFNLALANEENFFLMLKNNKVNVRYGPSFDYPIKYIYKKIQLPVRVIDRKENFRRILDHKNNSGWIHISQLRKSKSLIVLENKILFNKPSKFSKPVARIEKGRLLLVKKCENKWCKIKTGEFAGWIDKENTWGSIN
jgi:SH3-like domain-containing protein